jgi:hypothetical protein
VKFTLLAPAAVLLVVSVVTLRGQPWVRQRWIAVGAGFVAGLVVLGALIGYRFDAMLGDVAALIDARAGSVTWSRIDVASDMVNRTSVVITAGRVFETVLEEAIPTLLVFTLAVVVPADVVPGEGRRGALVLAAVVWGLSMLALLSSWQWGESPLFAALALALLELERRDAHPLAWRRRACVWLTACCVALFVGKNLESLVYDEYIASTYGARWDSFKEPQARGLAITGSDSECQPERYAARLEEVLAELRKIPDPRVVALDFSNPFPFLGPFPPPHGGGLCWHNHSTFNADDLPEPDRILGDANVVVVPKCPEDARAARAIRAACEPVLQTRFHRRAETGAFIVLESNESAPAAPPASEVAAPALPSAETAPR